MIAARPRRRRRRRGESGQGLIEGAGSLICCLLVLFASIALTAIAVAKFEIDSAAANATAATLAAPLGAGDQSKRFAADAFDGSLATHPWIQPTSVLCTSEAYFQGRYAPGSKIECVGTARVRLSMLPIPGGLDFTLSHEESVRQPALRQCATITSSQDTTGC
jgi:hypothetical protein